jgi:hypothetical protein
MYKFNFVISLLFALLLFSCSDKYMAYTSQYSFKSESGRPDYRDLNYWAAHPWKKDPSDSIPGRLKEENRDSVADVFFLHPTSYTQKARSGKKNAAADDSYLNAKPTTPVFCTRLVLLISMPAFLPHATGKRTLTCFLIKT